MFDLSVIICCYRGENTIDQCLEAICNQDYDKSKYQVILIDDGSKDGTSNKINSFINSRENSLPEINYYRKDNEGLSLARNYGLKQSNGRYISYIDEDAKADPKFIRKVVESFDSHKKVNCIGGKVDIWNVGDRFACLYHYSLFNWKMLDQQFIIGTNMSYRNSFLIDIGGFVPQFDKRGDEDALFSKAGRKLKKYISNDIIVEHCQPKSIKHFIMTRYENGYYKALITIMRIKKRDKILQITKAIIGHVLYLTLPLITFLSIIFNWVIWAYSLAFLIIIYYYRYIVKGELLRPLQYLKKSKLRVNISDYLTICNAIIRGFLWEDIGFLKGMMSKF